jgi:hypothetical protein
MHKNWFKIKKIIKNLFKKINLDHKRFHKLLNLKINKISQNIFKIHF